MRITVNGRPRDVAAETTLLSLLLELGVDARRSAAALNATAVPRRELGERKLADGDTVEIVEAVGGG
jgi:sulfur carrier protein